MKRFTILATIFVFKIFCYSTEFDLGISYFVSGKYELAEYMFRKSYILKENQTQNKLFLAHTCYINKKYKEAKELYSFILEDQSLPQEDTDFVKFMYAECCIFLKDYTTAIKILDQIDLNRNPLLTVYTLYGKIFSFYKLAEYNSVLSNITILKSYIKTNKVNIDQNIMEQIEFLLAETWFAKGDYKNATESYNSFISKYKKGELVTYARVRLANIYDEQKKYDMSESVLKSVSLDNIVPIDVGLIIKYNLAKSLLKQNKFDNAIKLYLQIIEEVKHNKHEILPYLLLDLAYCYFKTGNYNKTISVLTENKIDNKKIVPHCEYLLSLAYYNNGNYQKAEKIFYKLLKLYPDNHWYTEILYWLGLTYYQQAEYKKAISTLEQFEKNKSSIYYIPAQVYLAKSYRELKEYELAKVKLNKLKETKGLSDNIKSVILFELAECYKLTSDYQTAIQYYKQILELTKKQKVLNSVKIALAEVYTYLNDYENAEKILQEIDKKSLSQELSVKLQLIYLKIKFYTAEYDIVEKVATELLEKGKFSNKQEKNFVLSILVNLYSKTNNFEKLLYYTDKFLETVEDQNTKFDIQLKVLKMLETKNMWQKLYTYIVELKKQYKSSQYQSILNYYLLKYYCNTGQKEPIINLLSSMKTFAPEDYRFFTKNELAKFIDICMNYDHNFAVSFIENVISSLEKISNEEKVEIIKKIIEQMFDKKNYNAVIKLAVMLKKISYDDNIKSYAEFIIARVYELTGRDTFAENIYKTIIEKYPNSELIPQVYLSLINYYTSKNKTELVQFYEEQFVNKYKNTIYVDKYLYDKSVTFMKNGDYEKAIKYLLDVLNSNDKDVQSSAQKLLADCYYNMGKYKEAAVEYLRVIYLYPDKTDLCAESQYMIGVCTEKLNLYDEAKKAYRNSMIKYPGTLWAQEAENRLKKLNK